MACLISKSARYKSSWVVTMFSTSELSLFASRKVNELMSIDSFGNMIRLSTGQSPVGKIHLFKDCFALDHKGSGQI